MHKILAKTEGPQFIQHSSWVIHINVWITEDNGSQTFFVCVGLTHFAGMDPGAQRAKFSAQGLSAKLKTSQGSISISNNNMKRNSMVVCNSASWVVWIVGISK